ncbi:MAG: DUF554 domain-containing protein [Anaerolineae bacterium]|jgi:hypothetical protein|nr:DUF554 domain-containing protein [Anaerolineae bacterium]
MGGTLINAAAVLVGSLLGMLVGDRLPQRTRETVIFGLGLVVLVIALGNAQATKNILIPLFSIAVGALIGEALRLDMRLEALGGWLQKRFGGAETLVSTPEGLPSPVDDRRARFITGFITTSLVFCIGPLTVMGSIQDGMGIPAGFQQLVVKSVIDAFASVAFAATFGLGVAFTALTVLVVQGGLALLGSFAGQFMTTPMIDEMTATGGLILIGLSLILMDIKRPRMANFLPALLIAPFIVAVGTALGVNLYPL